MAVETATFIEQLNPAWPDDNDEIPEGDDHIRLTKGTLQTQFPNLGVVVPVNPTAVEINHMVGVTSGVQAQLDSGVAVDVTHTTDIAALDVRVTTLEALDIIPATTRMLFRQAAVPTGWTLVADAEDRVIMNRSGTGGGTGGTWVIGGITADGHVLSEAEMPAHAHVLTQPSVYNSHGSPGAGVYNNGNLGQTSATMSTVGGNAAHVHGVTSDGTWRPAFVDVVTGAKD